MNKIFKKKYLLIGLCLVILAAIVGAIIFLQPVKAESQPFDEAKKIQEITIKEDGDIWVITPKEKSKADFIFYTGGLVEEKAYIYNLAKVSAQETITIYIPKILLNLAFFDIGAADKVIKKYNLSNVYVGGHSLGGVAACYYTKDHMDKVKGLILMASYCDKPIKDFKGEVLSMVGDNDGIIDIIKKDASDVQLPEQSQVATIPGMNHAQFGHYGPQKGEKTPEQLPKPTEELLETDRSPLIPNDQATQEILGQMQALMWGATYDLNNDLPGEGAVDGNVELIPEETLPII
jgi:Alpha/beta hydrolase family